METDLAYQDEPWEELIDGKIVAMSPGPAWNHISIGGNLYRIFSNFLHGKKCTPIPDGMDLYLTEKDRFIPDLMVVCDPSIIKSNGVHGAPDLVVEILSPSTQRHDRFTKFCLYQRAGVREYWIVDPDNRIVQSFVLEDGRYSVKEFGAAGDKIKVNVLEDCVIDLSEVFSEA